MNRLEFSPRVKEVISYSSKEALRFGYDYIGVEHLLLGMIRERDGLAILVLKLLGVNISLLRKSVEEAIKNKATGNTNNMGNLPLTNEAEKVFKITVVSEAKALNDDIIGTEHLLLSILKNTDNIATQVLKKYDVDYGVFKTALEDVKNDIASAPFDDESYLTLHKNP